jgi:hypothetical protein
MNIVPNFRHRRSCGARTARDGGHIKLRYFWPLVGFVAPTLVIGFGYVIPKSCIAGINELTIGFLSSVAGASLTYWAGIRAVVRDHDARHARRDDVAGPS